MDPNQPFSGKFLRDIRKEAKFTQRELAKRIHISRETIIAIENERPGTIQTIQLETLKRWWRVCDTRISSQTRLRFTNYVKKFLKLP